MTRVLWFTRAMVSQAEAAGITVVGVRSPATGAATPGWRRWGSPIGSATRWRRRRCSSCWRGCGRGTRSTRSSSHLGAADARRRPGALIVGRRPAGRRGARGGDRSRRRAWPAAASTVLVDCNESSPGVARRLGLRLQPHVLDAVELATAGGDLRRGAGRSRPESVPAPRLPFDVMAGLPAPSEWQRFPPAAADVLLAACRSGLAVTRW